MVTREEAWKKKVWVSLAKLEQEEGVVVAQQMIKDGTVEDCRRSHRRGYRHIDNLLISSQQSQPLAELSLLAPFTLATLNCGVRAKSPRPMAA